MPKKYYAVKNGKSGSAVYFSWEDCKAQVEGVPGVSYKGFASLDEAEAFLTGKKQAKTRRAEKQIDPPEYPFKAGVAIAYVDGSYNKKTGEFSGGGVLFYEHEKVEFSKKHDDPQLALMRNVAGEIMGAVMVLRYCIEHKIPEVEIYHDYAGVGRWATGAWKTNKPGTQAYAAFCQKAMKYVKITFIDVTGHSGDYWNDEADRLAKAALGI